MTIRMWWLVLLSVGCKHLPEHTPDAVLGTCGNRILEEGEACEPATSGMCGAPGTVQACQLTCLSESDYCGFGVGCDDLHRCQYVVALTPSWSGQRSFQELELLDVDGDDRLDIIGADIDGIDVLRGDGVGGFADEVHFAYRDVRSGPLVIGDFNDDGIVEIAAVVGTNGNAIDLMRLDGAGLAVAVTLPLASDERVLAITPARLSAMQTRELVILLETASGRVLRRYRRNAGGNFDASTAVDHSDPRFESFAEPVMWTVAGFLGEGRDAIVAVLENPSSLVWISEFSGLYVNTIGTPAPVTALVGAPEGIRNEVGNTTTYTMVAYADGTAAKFATPATFEALGARAVPTPLRTFAWVQHRGAIPGTLVAAVPEGGSYALALGGLVDHPALLPIPRLPERLRTGDLDDDGLADFVLVSADNVDAFLSKGQLDP
jgi:hypothetical protein